MLPASNLYSDEYRFKYSLEKSTEKNLDPDEIWNFETETAGTVFISELPDTLSFYDVITVPRVWLGLETARTLAQNNWFNPHKQLKIVSFTISASDATKMAPKSLKSHQN